MRCALGPSLTLVCCALASFLVLSNSSQANDLDKIISAGHQSASLKLEPMPIVATSGLSQDDLLQIAASVELSSEHPLAAAIVQGAKDRGLRLQPSVFCWRTPTTSRRPPASG